MNPELTQRILDSERLAKLLRAIRVRSATLDFPTIRHERAPSQIDWSFAMMCASFLLESDVERAQDAALRIVQGCLTDPSSDETVRTSAAVMLDRMGNHLALELAQDRELVPVTAWEAAPPAIGIEVIRSQLDLTVLSPKGESLHVNRFQRDFWSRASTDDWISISAATSVGKSFIVRNWIEERSKRADFFRAVYLVPTRALIDEVSHALRVQLPTSVRVFALPWEADVDTTPAETYVLTQERLHLMHDRFPSLAMDVIFVDEAQKLDDGARGILLQRVIAEAVRRAPGAQVFFASPMSANPGELLEGVPEGLKARAMTSESVTVAQNLFWVNQIRGHPRRWSVDLVSSEQPDNVGELTLSASPSPTSKRLPLVAVAMSGESDSNVVYVNGAADAEKCASQIFEALGPQAEAGSDAEIVALRELSSAIVHDSYSLDTVLRRRVAFHYGNMPLLLRGEIERLFRTGSLRYLVCTSTLLEGVNLPCKNVFARGPRRGRGNPMTPADFWNLAGRAGRWGQEFQGNIVCIDTSDTEQWPTVPRSRVRYPLARAVDPILRDVESLVHYVESGTPVATDSQTASMEGVYSFLAGRLARGHPLTDMPGFPPISMDSLQRLQSIVEQSLSGIEFPFDLVERHAGISPLSMQRLLDLFAEGEAPEDYAVSPPESDDAVDTVVAALGRLTQCVGGNFGTPPRQYMLALLIVNWMRGWPLARLISDRLAYLRRNGREVQVGKVIRECMADVEQIARFEAPKYLSCYIDVLRFHYQRLGVADQMPMMPDVAMLLELGVSRTTELSLLSLGMSRSSAIALSEFIVGDELSRDECIAWLENRDLDQLSLPVLVIRDIRNALQMSR